MSPTDVPMTRSTLLLVLAEWSRYDAGLANANMPAGMPTPRLREVAAAIYDAISVRDRCVYPECTHSRRTRGLCHGHYQTMRSYVRKGTATEADLEARGLLLAKGTGGSKITTGHALFLKP